MLARIAERAHEAIVVNTDDAYLERLAGGPRPEVARAPVRRVRPVLAAAPRGLGTPRRARDDSTRPTAWSWSRSTAPRPCSPTAAHPCPSAARARHPLRRRRRGRVREREGRARGALLVRDRGTGALSAIPAGVRPRRARRGARPGGRLRARAESRELPAQRRQHRARHRPDPLRDRVRRARPAVLLADGCLVARPGLDRQRLEGERGGAHARRTTASRSIASSPTSAVRSTTSSPRPHRPARREDHRLLGRRDASHARAPRTHGSGMTLTIVSLLPSLQNTNGDAENARPRGARRWPARRPVGRSSTPPTSPRRSMRWCSARAPTPRSDAAARLLGLHDELRRPWDEGVPILAVGTGESRAGASSAPTAAPSRDSASSPGRAVPATAASPATSWSRRRGLGLLVGFENHARDYVGPRRRRSAPSTPDPATAADRARRGVRMGDVIGTAPARSVLAKNPAAWPTRSSSGVRVAPDVDYAPGEPCRPSSTPTPSRREAAQAASAAAPVPAMLGAAPVAVVSTDIRRTPRIAPGRSWHWDGVSRARR